MTDEAKEKRMENRKCVLSRRDFFYSFGIFGVSTLLGFLRFVFPIRFAVAQSPTESGPAASGERKPLDPEVYAQVLQKVLPKEGYALPIKWGDLGPNLAQTGTIDLAKFKQLYEKNVSLRRDLHQLEASSEAFITITAVNAQFVVNVFWALGLANKSQVLEKLTAVRPERELMRLASTGGWTLGAKPTAELYSNFDIIRLTPKQEELVSDLAQSIYRPCCDNPTAFPDCNHGIALLGLIELMAANGFSRNEILRASLKFNSFWFPQHYVKTALLLQLRGIDWDTVDFREFLGSRYSSRRGWTQNVDKELKKLAHLLPSQREGAGCGVSG